MGKEGMNEGKGRKGREGRKGGRVMKWMPSMAPMTVMMKQTTWVPFMWRLAMAPREDRMLLLCVIGRGEWKRRDVKERK